MGVIWQWISQHPSHSEVMGVNPAFSEATKALCLNATVTKVPEGSVLFQQGQPGACAYLLLKGTCDIRFTPRLMEAYAAHAGAQRGNTASGLHALLRGTGTRQPRSRRSPRSGHGGEKEGSLNVGGLTPQQLDDAVGPTMMHMTAGAVIGDSAALISSMAYTAASRANGTSERACTVIATSACELLRVSHRVFRACTESAPQTMELQDLVLGLAEMQVFRSWSPTELTFLAKWTSQQEYRSGEVIFEEGSEVTSVCFLLRGEVVLKSRRHVRCVLCEVCRAMVCGVHLYVLVLPRTLWCLMMPANQAPIASWRSCLATHPARRLPLWKWSTSRHLPCWASMSWCWRP